MQFPAIPNNVKKQKQAYVNGFAKAIVSSNLSAVEKTAWLKYAAEQVAGPMQMEQPPVQDIPQDGGGQPSPEEIQEILASLPGNTLEEKLQAAVAMLAQQHEGSPAEAAEGEQGAPVG